MSDEKHEGPAVVVPEPKFSGTATNTPPPQADDSEQETE